ncbi:hypothetical protein Hanom_Chr04g00317941 [Helianthus anomalus]
MPRQHKLSLFFKIRSKFNQYNQYIRFFQICKDVKYTFVDCFELVSHVILKLYKNNIINLVVKPLPFLVLFRGKKVDWVVRDNSPS